MSKRIALTTYSVKPRGGVVHTLELADALQAQGADVTIIAMGDPEIGFFREVDVPVRIVQAPAWGETLEERVFSWIEAMYMDLKSMQSDFDIVHSQDCISARAAARVRDEGAGFRLIRTVHHVDDFSTQALIDCQISAIVEPDQILVVSKLWQDRLREDYDVDPTVITNGVRTDRFSAGISDGRRSELRSQLGSTDRFLFLTVGGIEPRKGSEFLIEALAQLKADPCGVDVTLAVIGGHSFQDYAPYRERVLGALDELGLETGVDIVLLGTVADDVLPDWFHAADAFVFPSVNEGWGLVVLEAMSAGLPIVTSDLPVFHEFLQHDENVIMTITGDSFSLAEGMNRLIVEHETAHRLADAGPALADRFSWESTASQHLAIYG